MSSRPPTAPSRCRDAVLLLLALSVGNGTAVTAADTGSSATLEDLVRARLAEFPADDTGAAAEWLTSVTGSTSAHSVSPGAFIDDNQDGATLAFVVDAGVYIDDVQIYLGCAAAPVELPDGATITGFLARVRDGDSSTNLVLRLRRKAIGTTTNADVLSTLVSSGSAFTSQLLLDLSPILPLIDNETYFYYVDFCLTQSDGELQGVYLLFAN